MTERKRIQPRVDAELWERFRKDVKERKGQVRGVLGDELENAIRQYLSENQTIDDSERLRRMENILDRMQSQMGMVPADGGVDTSDAEIHTHAPSRIDAATAEKPAPNAATDKKVAYLSRRVRDETGIDPDQPGMVPRSTLRDIVKDEYGFRRDTAKRYVESLIAAFDLTEHPDPSYDLLVTPAKLDELRDQERDDASERMEDL